MGGMESIGFEGLTGADAAEAPNESDPGKVQEDAKRAKQARQQIQKSQEQNLMYAEMLKIILKTITDNKLLQQSVSFISDHDQSIDNIFGFLIPFVKDHIKNEDILILFKDYINIDCHKMTDYSQYCKLFITNYIKEFNLDKKVFLNFILELLCFFKVSGLSLDMMSSEDQAKMKKSLGKEIF